MNNLINKNNKNGWILAVIILAIVLQNPTQPLTEPEKKQSISEWGNVGMGILLIAGGTVAMIATGGAAAPAAGAIIASGALLAFGGTKLFSGIAGIFTPDIGIPGWVWIGAFIILALVILRKKK